MNKEIFKSLATTFNKNGFRLYIIGGTSRDFLLDLDVLDYDFVTDATPDDMKKFLPDANFAFAKFGTIRLKVDGLHVDITSMRIEGEYKDYRHPSKIEFVKDISLDYKRRDFTINAIYIDEKYNVIDPSGLGLKDLNDHIIRFIGDPEKRIKEDPLRIVRAERFESKLGFKVEDKSYLAMKKYRFLLEELNPDKLDEEKRKMKK